MTVPFPLPPLPPLALRARPRAYLNAHYRGGELFELRALSERTGSCIAANVWAWLGLSASGSTLESATARCWRRWHRLTATQQNDLLTAATMELRAKGMI